MTSPAASDATSDTSPFRFVLLGAAALLFCAAPFACATGEDVPTQPTGANPPGQTGGDNDSGTPTVDGGELGSDATSHDDTGGGGNPDSGGTRETGTGADSGGTDAIPDRGHDTGGGNTDAGCVADQNPIYVITDDKYFHRFNPTARTFTRLAKAGCSGTPETLAIDRQGWAWVLFDDGNLHKVNINDGTCLSTGYAKSSDFPRFGLSFLSANGGAEKLYAGDDGFKGLATIDTTTLKLSYVGGYDGFASQVALTGTVDGRLFALFPEADPFDTIRVGELDPSSGKIKNVPKGLFGETAGDGWAIVHWGGQFWIFTAPEGETKVMTYNYDKSDWTTVKEGFTSIVVGAATATCDAGPR
jgi:hypothetical protein